MAADLIGAVLLSRTREDRDFTLPDKPDVAIGYDRSNDLSIAFEGVSRRHARISYDGKEYWIEDVGSANGTFLNAVRLTQRERLKHLDIVTLGRRADLIFVRRSVDPTRKTKRGILAAKLEIIDGLEAGTSREIPRGSVTIGRTHGNNIVADSQLVSKVHARVERSGVQMLVTDLQSANGTFVNGEKIDSKILKDGDEISVGHARSYRVRIEEGDVLTGDVPMPRTTTSSQNASLPSDWKTCMEWSPEEAAIFEKARAEFRAGVLKRESKPAAKEPAKPKPAAAKPEHKPAAKPPEAAAPAKAQAVAEPPKPVAPAAPAPPATPAPPPEVKPAPEPPAAPTPVKVEVEAPPPPKPPAPAVSVKPEAAVAPPQPAAPAPPATPTPPAQVKPEPKPAVAQGPAPKASAAPTAEEETRALTPAQAIPPRLLLESAARTFPISIGTHEIGRSPDAAIHLEGSEISRRHAVLRVSETEAILEDHQTANGTFVNKQRITSPRSLVDGDTVAFGSTSFRVRMAPAAPPRPPGKPS